MTDEPSAQDIALDIARQIAEKWVSGKLHFLAIPAITSCIESALLRERARGMRDGTEEAAKLIEAGGTNTRRYLAECIRRKCRARETEGTK